MGQSIKHRKPLRRRNASYNRDVFSGLSHKEVRLAPYSASHAASLSHLDECRYLHSILTSSLPYYSAKVKLSHLRGRVAKTRCDAKNHNFLTRLTAKGMVILKARYANKPKNPE